MTAQRVTLDTTKMNLDPWREPAKRGGYHALVEYAERLEDWQSSVSGALRSWDLFDAGEWAGDKSGWGYHIELIGFLMRHYDATKSCSD